jgi:CelD/BcsL family acetyltransferase involved in cellulose biosynthesis
VSFFVARSSEDVEALRTTWKRLENATLSSDIDIFQTFVRHAPGVVRPHVVVVEEAGEPAALVVGRLEDVALDARLFKSHVRELTVVHGGVVGDVAAVGPRALLEALSASVDRERVDLVRFRMLTTGSPLHAAAVASAPALRRQRFPTRTPHWAVRVPSSMDDFLAARSKERRKNVRRHARRLEEAYGADAQVRFFRNREDLGRLFADSERVHRTSYQHFLGVGFSADELHRRLTGLSMKKGWFLGAILYLRNNPVAFQHGHIYRGTYGASGTAFDPSYRDLRPGTYLLMKLVEELCSDPDVNRLDWGFGDADYKRAFADEHWLEQDIGVYARRPRALALNAAQSAYDGLTAAARAAAARTGSLPRLRRRRRGIGKGTFRGFLGGVLVLLAVGAGAGLAG